MSIKGPDLRDDEFNTLNKPVRVIDVIIDKDHPRYELAGKAASVGGIFYRELGLSYDDSESGEEAFTGFAHPLNPNINTLPLKNEIVYLVKGPNKIISNSGDIDVDYYQTVYKIFNHPHVNAYPVKDDADAEVDIQDGLNLNPEIAPLQPYPGDTIIEGRLAQSIRMSGGFSEINPLTDEDNINDPFILISNGQTNVNLNKNGIYHIVENIDKDPSSIYLTSNHIVPITLANQKRDSYDDVPDLPTKYQGEQVVLNAGRLTFNAKTDDILISSAKSAGINANTVNVDASDYLCIDAPKIFLGSKAREYNNEKKQPVMKGHEVEQFLSDTIDILKSMCNAMQAASNGGGPVVSLVKEGASALARLQQQQALINPSGKSNLKSTKTFVE